MCACSLSFSLFPINVSIIIISRRRVSQTGEIVLVSFPGRFYVSGWWTALATDFAVDFFRGFDG